MNVFTKIVWVFIALSMIITIIAAYLKVTGVTPANTLFVAGISLGLIAWFMVLTDMMLNLKLKRSFWLTSVIILPLVAPVVYMIRRNQLIR